MELEYYKIDQAARKLNCEPDEIEHLLETGKLRAHLYSNAKKYLVLQMGADASTGRGIATYSGLVDVPASYIQPLLHNRKITISGRVVLQNPKNIQHWNKTHPFKSDVSLSNLGIKVWAPLNSNQASDSNALLAIPLPTESLNGMRLAMEALSKFSENQSPPSSNKIPQDPTQFPELSYSYSKNGQFDISSLRITQENLEGLTSLIEQQNSKSNAPLQESKLPWCDSKEKASRIDRVIERLFSANASKQAKALWLTLMDDYELDTPAFDTQHVIQAMDEDAIEWLTSEGYGSELQFKSFANKISTLRKYYESNNLS